MSAPDGYGRRARRGLWQAERADYATKINDMIQKEVDRTSRTQQKVGLLERFRAMDELVSENGLDQAADLGGQTPSGRY
jgi:hypothetical protein